MNDSELLELPDHHIMNLTELIDRSDRVAVGQACWRPAPRLRWRWRLRRLAA